MLYIYINILNSHDICSMAGCMDHQAATHSHLLSVNYIRRYSFHRGIASYPILASSSTQQL